MTSSSVQHRAPLFLYPALPKWEMRLYWVVLITVLSYAYFCVYDASNHFQWGYGFSFKVHDLPFFGTRIKDTTNWEWGRWVPFALQYIPALLGHIVVFNVGEKFLPKTAWEVLTLAYSIAACSYLFTPWLVTLSIIQATFVFGMRVLTGKTMGVWIGVLPILWYTLHRTSAIHDDPFVVLLFMSYTLLSYISYNLDYLRGKHRPEENTHLKSFFRMMYYAFYLPYLVSLIVLYSDFERQLQERPKKERNWKDIIKFAARITFWWLFIEFMLHFMYFEAIFKDVRFAYKLTEDRFVSLGMAVGAFFHMKYVVIFGLPAMFARIDNMQPQEGPMCLIRVALYSKIWRNFDRGLYAFFKQYIFVPICQPTFSLPRKLFGVIISYMFVLLWHGFHHNNVVWIVLNVLELFIEIGAKSVYAIPAVKNTRERYISDRAFRRILAWLQIVPFVFGLYSNFYFLCGSKIGYAFVDRIFWGETVTLQWPFFMLITTGYFYCHVAMEVERLKQIKQEKQKET
uniref:Protein-cysteine N-palmitoyltransferase Rasp n=1 Tax=Plectus sambesii TaxID=2011161 RepID=A0A914WJF1_9BILA